MRSWKASVRGFILEKIPHMVSLFIKQNIDRTCQNTASNLSCVCLQIFDPSLVKKKKKKKTTFDLDAALADEGINPATTTTTTPSADVVEIITDNATNEIEHDYDLENLGKKKKKKVKKPLNMEEVEAALPDATEDNSAAMDVEGEDGLDDTFDLGQMKKKKKKKADISELLDQENENGKRKTSRHKEKATILTNKMTAYEITRVFSKCMPFR
jgi:hypothetical protein